MKKVLLCLLLLVSPTLVYASEIEESITVQKSNMEMRGEGVRSKFFIDLYKARLYAEAEMSRTTILSDNGKAVITLEIVSGMITSEKMETATREGFERSLSGEKLYTNAIEQFIAVFKEEIVEGDTFSFAAQGKNITIYKNKSPLTVMNIAGFRHALFGIWLGADPVSQSLKEDMLGQ